MNAQYKSNTSRQKFSLCKSHPSEYRPSVLLPEYLLRMMFEAFGFSRFDLRCRKSTQLPSSSCFGSVFAFSDLSVLLNIASEQFC